MESSLGIGGEECLAISFMSYVVGTVFFFKLAVARWLTLAFNEDNM